MKENKSNLVDFLIGLVIIVVVPLFCLFLWLTPSTSKLGYYEYFRRYPPTPPTANIYFAYNMMETNLPPSASKKSILEYTETNIEGCQYLVSRTYMGFEVLCHKGNCTNHLAARVIQLQDIPKGYYGHPYLYDNIGPMPLDISKWHRQTNNGIISYSIEN